MLTYTNISDIIMSSRKARNTYNIEAKICLQSKQTKGDVNMKTLKERLSELEKELTPVCKAHEDDCDKCPYKCTKCREYAEIAAELER